MKFISIINLKHSFHLLLFFQELYSKEPGGGLISTRNIRDTNTDSWKQHLDKVVE